MAHYKILFIGNHQDLENIYNDCPDSSSESRAEMAFAYDYIGIYEDDRGSEKSINDLGNTLTDTYSDCWDIRDRILYRCIDSVDWKERLTEKEMENFFNSLPKDTTIFYANGHL